MMTSADNQRIERLFLEAIELPESDREDYLRQQVANDDPLLDHVRCLLREHASGSNTKCFILDRPPCVTPYSSFDETIGERTGEHIGSYQLLEQIGEGGMGVVYMAEQTEGVRRKVALKIVKLGMDTRQVVARFEAERQAMALFEHPNIARVLDAGATDSGRPYFVMELVRGTDIISFCDSRKLDLTEKLKLFVGVCQAVQHAHQKGIIHRDLKPSNVLVTLSDGIPVPKVIDFGIAKAIGRNLTDETLFTRYSAAIGTPQYMSPEQAEMSGQDVDTRSDIYSLGVILYELITGTTPLKKETLRNLNPLAFCETLRDANFETPSTRITKSQNINIKRQFHGQSQHRLKNELDWVVMKSLARNRQDRYVTANEFAADILRFINGDTVKAMPPSLWYELTHWMRRNLKAVIVGCIMVGTLLAWAIMSSLSAHHTSQLNNKHSNALTESQLNLERAQEAEANLRLANQNQLYLTAHSVALSKFSWIYLAEFDKFASEIANEIVSAKMRDDPTGLEYKCHWDPNCLSYDRRLLADFPDHQHFDLPLQALRNSLDERERLDEDLSKFHKENPIARFQVNETPRELTAEEKAELEREIQEVGKQTGIRFVSISRQLREKLIPKLLRRVRPKFYRLVVQEYRNTFGETDPRIAEALTLLAVSLIETGNLNEAESHLREAIALQTDSSNDVQRALLKQIEELAETE